MNYTTNFNLRLPERNEQFNLDDWNNNTTSIDSAMQTNKTNISNNATNITSILNGLSTVNTDDASSIYYKLMKLIYPIGSLYWSSKSTNPASLFGGTWVQIKDRFVLACGDTYKTVGATGGASSVALSVSNMPSHNHSFTPAGTITMNAHYHGLNNHTHNFSGRTEIMSDNSSGSFNARRSDILGASDTIDCGGNVSRDGLFKAYKSSSGEFSNGGVNYTINVQHSHTFSGTTGGSSGKTTPTTSTGSFSGTQGTTDSKGSGTAFSILPPYVVKYCFERTA